MNVGMLKHFQLELICMVFTDKYLDNPRAGKIKKGPPGWIKTKTLFVPKQTKRRESETDISILQTTSGPSGTCVSDFSGTSSACPLASGIIAQTLQAK